MKIYFSFEVVWDHLIVMLVDVLNRTASAICWNCCSSGQSLKKKGSDITLLITSSILAFYFSSFSKTFLIYLKTWMIYQIYIFLSLSFSVFLTFSPTITSFSGEIKYFLLISSTTLKLILGSWLSIYLIASTTLPKSLSHFSRYSLILPSSSPFQFIFSLMWSLLAS